MCVHACICGWECICYKYKHFVFVFFMMLALKFKNNNANIISCLKNVAIRNYNLFLTKYIILPGIYIKYLVFNKKIKHKINRKN